MHSLSHSPLTPAWLWWKQAWVALARPCVIKSSNTSCSGLDQMVWASMRTFQILDWGWKKAWWARRAMLLWSLPRRFFACERSVGHSQCWTTMTSLGLERRLLAIVGHKCWKMLLLVIVRNKARCSGLFNMSYRCKQSHNQLHNWHADSSHRSVVHLNRRRNDHAERSWAKPLSNVAFSLVHF